MADSRDNQINPDNYRRQVVWPERLPFQDITREDVNRRLAALEPDFVDLEPELTKLEKRVSATTTLKQAYEKFSRPQVSEKAKKFIGSIALVGIVSFSLLDSFDDREKFRHRNNRKQHQVEWTDKLERTESAPFGVVDLRTRVGKAIYREAARLAGVPQEWIDSPALRKLVAHESAGRVGVPNYTYGRKYADPRFWDDIHQQLRYGEITAKSSATGLGQLLRSNVVKYYPSGVEGIGDPVEEAAGQLGYIKDIYKNPENAWGNHSANPRRHKGVADIYHGEGY